MNLRIPLRVTDRAFRKIADSCESKTLRVAVKGGGCSGFQYIFNIVDKVGDDDKVFEKDEMYLFANALKKVGLGYV